MVVDVGKHVFIFFLQWQMVCGFYLGQALLSKVIVKGFPPSMMKKERGLKLLDQPIHFTDEQTETSTISNCP